MKSKDSHSSKRNIFITGATGMIGLALIRSLLEHDRADSNDFCPIGKIYAIVRENSTKLSLLPSSRKVVPIACDLDNLYRLPFLIRSYEGDTDFEKLIKSPANIFYHFGWAGTGGAANRAKSDIQRQNHTFSIQAVHAAADLGCCKFIGAGSQAEYGLCSDNPIRPDSVTDPVSPYGIAKLIAGETVLEICPKYHMDGFWVRIFSVYGTRDRTNSMIMSTIAKLKKDEKPSFTPAEQLWDYLNEKDAGNAFRLIGEKSTGNKVYCLGCGQSRPLAEYIYTIRDAVDPSLPVGIGDLPYPYHAVMNLCADISALQKDTGWKPEVRFEDGIKDILKHWKE